MVIVVLLWLVALAVGVWAVWTPVAASRAAAAASKPEEPVPADDKPDSLEGVLVAQLFRGEINTAQYRRAVEGLAARDEQRHPMSVPDDET